MSNILDSLATRRFIQIPGPNPIVKMGGEGEWDEDCIEAGDIFKDYIEGQEVYYFYYHGVGKDKTKWSGGYRNGVATATHPMGPFTKAPQNPILDLGPEGSWEDHHVACPCIIKEGPDKYIMLYWGMNQSRDPAQGSIGLATAPHPLGPWTKHEGNPILEGFGYPGGLTHVGGKYYLHNAFPIGSTGADYSPFALATADSLYGPWELHDDGKPVLAPSGWGAWDDGGYSEAKVVYRDGVFHTFYGGAKLHPWRRNTLESIGYACSLDGIHFVKHVDNPVALREKNPDASAFAEVQCLIEPPFIYLYHTLRYLSCENTRVEDLGVQVLATGTPFKLSMPVLNLNTLGPATATELAACPPVSLDHVSDLVLSVQCVYESEAESGVRVHVRASDDGFVYDTVDWQAFDNELTPGQVARRSVDVSPSPRFIKVIVENLDSQHSVAGLTVTATLGG